LTSDSRELKQSIKDIFVHYWEVWQIRKWALWQVTSPLGKQINTINRQKDRHNTHCQLSPAMVRLAGRTWIVSIVAFIIIRPCPEYGK
jgi:hypothetical protein